MRRPAPIKIEAYTAALDLQLRGEVRRVDRRTLPGAVHRFVRKLRSILQPIVQSGAIVLTSLAVIVAVGAAPATIQTPPPVSTPLATPSEPVPTDTVEHDIRDSLPPDEFLAVADESESVQEADIRDMPPMEAE